MESTGHGAEDEIGYLLVRLTHALSQRWTRDLADHGLSARQHGVLAVLAERPGMSSGAVARAALITPQSMGELLTGLEARGLVRRTPGAGRGRPAYIEVTTAARDLLADATPTADAQNDPAALGLSEAEAARLRTLLHQVLRFLG